MVGGHYGLDGTNGGNGLHTSPDTQQSVSLPSPMPSTLTELSARPAIELRDIPAQGMEYGTDDLVSSGGSKPQEKDCRDKVLDSLIAQAQDLSNRENLGDAFDVNAFFDFDAAAAAEVDFDFFVNF